jgi:hypothetical protein
MAVHSMGRLWLSASLAAGSPAEASEITYGYSTTAANASRRERDELFKTFNGA